MWLFSRAAPKFPSAARGTPVCANFSTANPSLSVPDRQRPARPPCSPLGAARYSKQANPMRRYVAISACLLLGAAVRADDFKLRDGSKISGIIVGFDDSSF